MSDWTSQRLGERHDLAQLDCGHDELDQWLLQEALRAQAAGTAHTTVWTKPDDFVVVAFHAIRRLVMKVATARAAVERAQSP